MLHERPIRSNRIPHNRQRLQKLGYRSIIPVNIGNPIFVDQAGLIDGLFSCGERAGQKRCDAPYPPPSIVDVMAAVAWIEVRGLVPIKTPTLGSYAAKHFAERWVGRHIPNGAAILAFHLCGFQQFVQPVSSGEMNTTIAVSRKSYRNLPEASCNSSDWPTPRIGGMSK